MRSILAHLDKKPSVPGNHATGPHKSQIDVFVFESVAMPEMDYGGLSPRTCCLAPTVKVKHTDQESGGELREIFKF